MGDLLHRLARRSSKPPVAQHLHRSGTEGERFELLEGEGERRRVEGPAQQIADTTLAVDRRAGSDQMLHVAIDRPLRDLHFLGNLPRRHRPAGRAQELDDAKQPVGGSHAWPPFAILSHV
ncbi:hypothetical protein D9M72_544740 [compost metagenome]